MSAPVAAETRSPFSASKTRLRRMQYRVGAGNYVTSCDLRILADQAAESVPA